MQFKQLPGQQAVLGRDWKSSSASKEFMATLLKDLNEGATLYDQEIQRLANLAKDKLAMLDGMAKLADEGGLEEKVATAMLEKTKVLRDDIVKLGEEATRVVRDFTKACTPFREIPSFTESAVPKTYAELLGKMRTEHSNKTKISGLRQLKIGDDYVKRAAALAMQIKLFADATTTVEQTRTKCEKLMEAVRKNVEDCQFEQGRLCNTLRAIVRNIDTKPTNFKVVVQNFFIDAEKMLKTLKSHVKTAKDQIDAVKKIWASVPPKEQRKGNPLAECGKILEDLKKMCAEYKSVHEKTKERVDKEKIKGLPEPHTFSW